ncbi:MAG TPA: DUF6599 family protein [Anaerolineae bacterium]|nr:DUF6599 family protein [Anaerolineae bacterium]
MRRHHAATRTWMWVCLLLAGFLAGCGSAQQEEASPTASPSATPFASLSTTLPPADLAASVAGWTLAGETEIYDRETLFGLVNGQADLFFVYGFEQAAVQNYEDAEGATIRLTIWQLATPQDAYGLLTLHASGSTASAPVDAGNGGSTELGQRLVFWQDRYFVDLFAFPPQPDNQSLLALAQEVSSKLPSGGVPPAVMLHLPADDQVEGSAIFFHQEIAIQDWLWLGGENLLGLDSGTDGVLARYDLEGAQAQLLLIQYPTEDAASAGLAALQTASLDGLVASAVHDDLLGAVWGEVDEAAAQDLLAKALNGE